MDEQQQRHSKRARREPSWLSSKEWMLEAGEEEKAAWQRYREKNKENIVIIDDDNEDDEDNSISTINGNIDIGISYNSCSRCKRDARMSQGNKWKTKSSTCGCNNKTDSQKKRENRWLNSSGSTYEKVLFWCGNQWIPAAKPPGLDISTSTRKQVVSTGQIQDCEVDNVLKKERADARSRSSSQLLTPPAHSIPNDVLSEIQTKHERLHLRRRCVSCIICRAEFEYEENGPLRENGDNKDAIVQKLVKALNGDNTSSPLSKRNSRMRTSSVSPIIHRSVKQSSKILKFPRSVLKCRVVLTSVPIKAMGEKCPRDELEPSQPRRTARICSPTSKMRQLICIICNRYFDTQRHLNNHLLIHIGEKPLKRNIVKKNFSKSYRTNTHRLTHSKEKFLSQKCSEQLSNSSGVQVQISSRSSRGMYLCKARGRANGLKASLESKKRGNEETGEKPWKCKICLKKFSWKASLKVHMLHHCNEKPYVCSVCHKGFSNGNYLKRHMVSHSSLCPHLCRICGLRFVSKQILKKHRTTHSWRSRKK